MIVWVHVNKKKNFTLEQRFIIIPSVCHVVDWCVRSSVFVYMSALFYVRTNFQLNSTSYPIGFVYNFAVFTAEFTTSSTHFILYNKITRNLPLNVMTVLWLVFCRQ